MRIALTGGGTAGHLFPLIAVTRALRELAQKGAIQTRDNNPVIEFKFIGPQTIGQEFLAQEGIKHKIILSGKLRRYASFQNVLDFFKLPVGLIQALWELFIFMPNVVVSKGGYGSVPVVIAAWVYRIPVLIHESDSFPGLANRISSKFSTRVAISFSEAAKYFPAQKTALTGNPVRAELLNGTKEDGKKIIGLSSTKPIIFFMGGSQGALSLNDVIFVALPHLLARCEVIHQCGPAHYEQYKQMLGQIPVGYFLFPFLDENQLKAAFGSADLIISRAGAGSIAEISASGKPSILIPLPNSAGEHQQKNAMEYGTSGATLIMEQMNLTPNLLQTEIFKLIDDPELLKKMSVAAKNFDQADSAQKIAAEVINIARF